MLALFNAITSNYNFYSYSSSQVKESTAQSVTKFSDNTNHPNEWESATYTESFLANALVETAEQLIQKFDDTDFTKIATQFGASMYQELNKLYEYGTQRTVAETKTHTFTYDSNVRFGSKEMATARFVTDDLDGFM